MAILAYKHVLLYLLLAYYIYLFTIYRMYHFTNKINQSSHCKTNYILGNPKTLFQNRLFIGRFYFLMRLVFIFFSAYLNYGS